MPINLVMSSQPDTPPIVAVRAARTGYPVDLPTHEIPIELVKHVESLIPEYAQQAISDFDAQIQALVIARRDYLNQLKLDLEPHITAEIHRYIEDHPEIRL